MTLPSDVMQRGKLTENTLFFIRFPLQYAEEAVSKSPNKAVKRASEGEQQ